MAEIERIRAIEISGQPLDTGALVQQVRDPAAGAVVLFEGITREVPSLAYEVFEPMARKLLTEHANTAIERFGLCAVAIAHRSGDVPTSEPSVGIAVSAPHRPEAFEAARWLIDVIKQDVPIWKMEHGEHGSAWGKSEWPGSGRSDAP